MINTPRPMTIQEVAAAKTASDSVAFFYRNQVWYVTHYILMGDMTYQVRGKLAEDKAVECVIPFHEEERKFILVDKQVYTVLEQYCTYLQAVTPSLLEANKQFVQYRMNENAN